MNRNTYLAAAAALILTLNASALESVARRVSPPPAGTPDDEIPTEYSRSVIGLRMTSNVSRTRRGGTMTATVWRWTDRRGTAYTLTRRLTSNPGDPPGNLGDYTLETVASARPAPVPFPRPVPTPDPMPLPGKLRIPPAYLTTSEIPAFYSPNGVRYLRIASNVGTDGYGRETTETVWKWRNNDGVSYTLTRVKSGFSTNYRLSKEG